MQLTIDREFESLCPKPTDSELAQLRSNLEEDGCRDPLVVWGCNGDELLVDGHNRYRLCQELGIGFKTARMRFESRDKAKQWILTNQLGRRNLTDEQRTRLIGLLYNSTKGTQGGDHGNQHTAKDQIDTLPTAAEGISEKFSVSVPTVKRAAKFAEAVEAIEEMAPEQVEEILSGKSGLTKPQVIKAGKSKSPKAAIASAKAENAAKKAKKKSGGSSGQIKDLIKSIGRDLDRLKKMLDNPGIFIIESDRDGSLSRLSMNKSMLLDVMHKLKE